MNERLGVASDVALESAQSAPVSRTDQPSPKSPKRRAGPGVGASCRGRHAPRAAGDHELMLDHDLHIDLQLWAHPEEVVSRPRRRRPTHADRASSSQALFPVSCSTEVMAWEVTLYGRGQCGLAWGGGMAAAAPTLRPDRLDPGV